MKKLFSLWAVVACVNLAVWAQTPASSPTPAAAQAEVPEVTPNGVIGTVKLVDTDSKQIIVSTKSKGNFIVQLNATTKFVKVAPGAKDLKNAEPIELNGFGAGDRVWARGTVEGNNVPAAKQVILMNKAEIAKKNDDERRDWVQRGIVGKVAGVNPETKDITLTIQRPPAPGSAGQPPAAPQTQNIIIPTTDSKVKIRRYTEETVKFSDAKPSKFEEVRVGDQLRALGNFNSTNTQYTPEQIVFGTFRTLTGKITAIDAAKNEITITDEEKKQAITLTLKPDSTLKRVDFGAMMMGGGFGGGMRPPGAGGPPSGGGQGAGQGAGTGGGQGQGQGQGTGGGQGQGRGPGGGGPGGPRMGGGRGFDIQALIDRMPETTLAALQVGEMIVVAGTKNQDPKRLTAITLLSNVEPLMAMMARFGGGQGGRPGGDGLGGGGFDLGGLGLP